jgi:hypothetical protein
MMFKRVGAAVVLTAAAVASVSLLGAASETPRDPVIHEAWLPPGEYSAIVLTPNVNTGTRRWIVHLWCRGQSVPIAVAPGESTVIPFTEGWEVRANDRVHLTSARVPFGTLEDFDPLDGEPVMEIAAWGIAKAGPVRLVPPQ